MLSSTGKTTRVKVTILLAVVSFLISHLLNVDFPGIFQVWELQSIDQLFRFRLAYRSNPESVDQNIALAYINDRGINKLNEEYKSGELYATLTELLSRCNAAGIGYDIIFARKSSLQNPQSFFESVEAAGNVYCAYAFQLSEEQVQIPSAYNQSASLLEQRKWKLTGASAGFPLYADTPFTPTLYEISLAAKGIGFINAPPDRDGVYRRLPLVLRYNEGFIPSLPFQMVCDYLNVKPNQITINFGKNIILHDAEFPDGHRKSIVIPIDEKGRMILNFPGPWSSYARQFPISDILEHSKDDELFSQYCQVLDGSLAIVADISTGVADMGPIPYQANYPLVGLHLTVLNSILTENFLWEIDPLLSYGIQLFVLICLVVISLKLRPLIFSVASILLIVLYVSFSISMFVFFNTIPQVIAPLLGFVLSLGSVLTYRYFSEEQEKLFIRKTFSSYFSPTVLKKIEENPNLLSLGGEKKILTVLFSDIVGFTSWSETQTPEQIKQTLNEYFEEMAQIIFKYDGYIDKYIGDGMMAFFGDPIHQEDHVARSVQASIEMQAKVRELEQSWSKDGRMPIKIRIGINTGEMIVGNMGSKSRMDYTVIGANVNLAQRLESNASVGGILISESVNDQIKDKFKTTPRGGIQVKGLQQSINVFEVVLEGGEKGQRLLGNS